MCAGLLRRVGLVLVAIAFLGGGLPRTAMFDFAAAPAAAMSLHDHGHRPAREVAHPASDCGTHGKEAPACQHPDECQACAALDVPVGAGTTIILHWTRLLFVPATPRLSGVMPPPELFPPIRRS